MVKLLLLFKIALDGGDIERRYGANLGLLKQMPGVRRIVEGSVLGGPGGIAAYHRVLEVYFEDFPALDAALNSPEGVAAGKDLIGFAGSNVEVLFVEETEPRSARPFTPQTLQAYLDQYHIAAEIVFPGKPTPTVPAAAQALGIEVDQIVKSVVFLVDEKPFLVYGCGTRRVDYRKLARRLNVGSKRVKLANPDQVLEITGYGVGTVPPIGLKTRMATFMDPAVRTYETIYAGGGGIDALLKMTSRELLRISEAEIAAMLEDEISGEAPQPEA